MTAATQTAPAPAATRLRLRAAVRGELLKARQGRALGVVLSLGVLMSAVTAYGYTVQGSEGLAAGTATADSVTGDVARTWMMMYLFAGIYAAVCVAREFDRRTLARTVLLARSRATVLEATTVVAVAVGLVFAAVAVVGAVVSCIVLLPTLDESPVWSQDVVLSIVGVAVCCVAAALFGSFVAWVVRHQLAAVLVVVLQTVLLEPALQRLWPEPASWLFTIALSAVYRDPKDDLLPVPLALLVAAAWIALLAALAWRSFQRRDVA